MELVGGLGRKTDRGFDLLARLFTRSRWPGGARGLSFPRPTAPALCPPGSSPRDASVEMPGEPVGDDAQGILRELVVGEVEHGGITPGDC